MVDADIGQDRLIRVTAEIVAAHIGHNHVQAAELPALIRSVHAALLGLGDASSTATAVGQRKASTFEIRRSITPEALISFEDGKPYKTLRRHLTLRGLSPEAYRAKWGLAADYPMTASAYSEQRSQLARDIGLGRAQRAAIAPANPVRIGMHENDAAMPEPAATGHEMAAELPSVHAEEDEDRIVREPFGNDGEPI